MQTYDPYHQIIKKPKKNEDLKTLKHSVIKFFIIQSSLTELPLTEIRPQKIKKCYGFRKNF